MVLANAPKSEKLPRIGGTSPVTRYAQDVVKGRIVAGELVRLACRRHLDWLADVQTGRRRDIRWNRHEAEDAISFFNNLNQYKGRWANQPLVLLDWEAFCVGSIFGWQVWHEELGRWVRLFREAYIRVARKQGKSTLAGGIGLWLLDYDGEPGAEVYAIATKRDQAKQVWEVAQQFVEKNAYLSETITHLRSLSRLVVYDTMSKFQPLGRDSHTEHGLNPSGAVVDELHVHRNRDMVDAIETAIGARAQPLIIYITTAGVRGVSIYNETDERAQRTLRGAIDNERLFVYIATLDPKDDWRDPSVYIKANPSLGHTVLLDELIDERDKAITTPGRRNTFIRLRLNTDTGAETAWLDIDKWNERAGKLTRNGRVHVGVDLGGRRDLSAAAKVTKDSAGGYDIDVRFWMPKDCVQEAEQRDKVPYSTWIEAGYITATPGDYRDDREIVKEILPWAAGCDEWDVDAWNSTTIIPELQDTGREVVVIPQTFASLSPSVDDIEKAIESGQLTHTGNPVMEWMIGNTALEETNDGARKPVKVDSQKVRRHIDGVSAILNAVNRLRVVVEDDTWGYGSA